MHVKVQRIHRVCVYLCREFITKITSNPHAIKSDNWPGNVVSRTSISFENLAKIRPVGVVSKNCNGARNEPNNRQWCIAMAANRQPIRGVSSQKKDVIAAMTRNKTRQFIGKLAWKIGQNMMASLAERNFIQNRKGVVCFPPL